MPRERVSARRLAAALALGLAHAVSLSFAGLWWLQLVSFGGLALLAFSTATSTSDRGSGSSARAAAIGFAFGLGWFVAGVGWLFISMHRYGGMPAPLALIALLLFGAYLALFPAAACALADFVCRRRRFGDEGLTPIAAASAIGGAFALSELLRGWLFTGFPWLSTGYAHGDGPFAGLAPIVGVFGVGAAACVSASLIALALRSAWRDRQRPIAPWLLAIAIAATGPLADSIDWAQPAASTLRVDLIQGNVAQDLKFDPARSLAAMNAYSRSIEPGRAQLIVMPETAWTVPWSQTPNEIATRIQSALSDGALAAIGMPLAAADRSGRITNSIAVIDGTGASIARYDKTHLVPFGEFIPTGFRWFVAMMNIPLGDFGRGASDQPMLRLRDQAIAFNICYEDLFGDELARQVRAGANVLINASNIAWFGDSHAPEQHLQIARMRARELARPMLRATNTGVTAAIDHQGRVLGRLPGYQLGTLSVDIAPTSGLTPFARWANLPAALIAITLLGAAAIRSRTRRMQPDR